MEKKVVRVNNCDNRSKHSKLDIYLLQGDFFLLLNWIKTLNYVVAIVDGKDVRWM